MRSVSFSFLFAVFAIILNASAAYAQSARVEIRGDDLPWLRGNQSGIAPSYNINGPLITGSGNWDPQKVEDGDRPLSPEEQNIDQPSNTMPFTLDRTLDRKYEDKEYAVFKILDKVTAKISTVKAKIGSTVAFGWIEVTTKIAKKTPPEEEPEAVAFIEVVSNQNKKGKQKIFAGFIFASSPSISGLEHPRYDIRLFDCLNQDELDQKPKAVEKPEQNLGDAKVDDAASKDKKPADNTDNKDTKASKDQKKSDPKSEKKPDDQIEKKPQIEPSVDDPNFLNADPEIMGEGVPPVPGGAAPRDQVFPEGD